MSTYQDDLVGTDWASALAYLPARNEVAYHVLQAAIQVGVAVGGLRRETPKAWAPDHPAAPRPCGLPCWLCPHSLPFLSNFSNDISLFHS